MYQRWTKENAADLDGKKIRLTTDTNSWFIGVVQLKGNILNFVNLEDTNSSAHRDRIGQEIHANLPYEADIVVMEDPGELYSQFLPEDPDAKKGRLVAELQELRSKSILSTKEKNLIAEAIHLIEGKCDK